MQVAFVALTEFITDCVLSLGNVIDAALNNKQKSKIEVISEKNTENLTNHKTKFKLIKCLEKCD